MKDVELFEKLVNKLTEMKDWLISAIRTRSHVKDALALRGEMFELVNDLLSLSVQLEQDCDPGQDQKKVSELKEKLNSLKNEIKGKLYLEKEIKITTSPMEDAGTEIFPSIHDRGIIDHPTFSLIESRTDIAFLEKKIRDLYSAIVPKKVSSEDKIYQQNIQRLCFRGEGIDRDPKKIFVDGINKKIDNSDYGRKLKITIAEHGPYLRIFEPFESLPTAVAVSKDLASAAIFPLIPVSSHIKVNDLLESLNGKLRQYQQPPLEVSRFGYDDNKNCDPAILNELLDRLNNLIPSDVKRQLEKDEALTHCIFECKREEFEDQCWIYVVYLEKGFDVQTHGILNLLQKDSHNDIQSLKDAIFAGEIAAEEIPAEHILAAIRIKRHFDDKRLSQPYYYSGQFEVEEIQYNDKAMQYLQEKGIDLNKYRLMLEAYAQKSKMKGVSFNTPESGYKISSPQSIFFHPTGKDKQTSDISDRNITDKKPEKK